MSRTATPQPAGSAARPVRPVPGISLSLVLILALAGVLVFAAGSSALASGARPWFAPGEQENATAGDAPAAAQPAVQSAEIPLDAAGQAQLETLRRYFHGQVTLDEKYLQVYSRRVKDGETMAFMALREMVRSRGSLARFLAAQVDLSGLIFTRVTDAPDLARIRVTGRYSFTLGARPLSTVEPTAPEPTAPETVEEDALFVLLSEMGEWKIFERREGWRP